MVLSIVTKVNKDNGCSTFGASRMTFAIVGQNIRPPMTYDSSVYGCAASGNRVPIAEPHLARKRSTLTTNQVWLVASPLPVTGRTDDAKDACI